MNNYYKTLDYSHVIIVRDMIRDNCGITKTYKQTAAGMQHDGYFLYSRGGAPGGLHWIDKIDYDKIVNE